jgi:multicomponent Na+:H+ antiporter subunit G
MNVFSLVLIYTGLLATLIGSYGIAKLGDIYSRLQASGASDTVGVILVLLGFLVRDGFRFSDSFLALLILFFFVTGPIITHSIGKTAFLSNVEPAKTPDRTEED